MHVKMLRLTCVTRMNTVSTYVVTMMLVGSPLNCVWNMTCRPVSAAQGNEAVG